MLSEVTFFILAGVAILSAALMVSRRKTLYSSALFALTLLATSGIFLQLHAPLLLAAQFVAQNDLDHTVLLQRVLWRGRRVPRTAGRDRAI